MIREAGERDSSRVSGDEYDNDEYDEYDRIPLPTTTDDDDMDGSIDGYSMVIS